MKNLKLCSTVRYYIPAILIFYIKMNNVIKPELLEIVISSYTSAYIRQIQNNHCWPKYIYNLSLNFLEK